MTNFKISLILESEKRELELLLNIYLLELNEEPNYPFLNSYWTDKNRIPLKLTKGKDWLGFAFINDYAIIPTNTISIAEFYILPEYRKQGLGRYFANDILQKYNGKWEIRTQISNNQAIQFWDKVVSEILNKNLEINQIKNEIVYSFGSN